MDFLFEVDSGSELNEFDLGHITIVTSRSEVTSKNKSPDQAMMIFIAVSDLLFAVMKLYDLKINESVEFVGADSSFSINFKKEREKIEVFYKKQLIEKSTVEALAKDLWRCMLPFYNKYFNQLGNDCAAGEDWESSMKLFESRVIS